MKRSSLCQFRSVCMLLVLGVVGGAHTPSAFGQATDNPQPVKLPVRWLDVDGKPQVSERMIEAKDGNGHWAPQRNGWNDRNTSAGNKVENIAMKGITFPFKDAKGREVTQKASNDFWDKAYLAKGQLDGGTYKRKEGSNAEFVMNSAGFSTGYGYWVQEPGLNVILQDEYEIFQDSYCKAGCIVRPVAPPHTIKIIECCPKGYPGEKDSVKKTEERNQLSGIYQGEWKCPPGFAWLDGTIYCKKK